MAMEPAAALDDDGDDEAEVERQMAAATAQADALQAAS